MNPEEIWNVITYYRIEDEQKKRSNFLNDRWSSRFSGKCISISDFKNW